MSSIVTKHKDTLFRKLFGDPEHKENLLSLYNALNGTDYGNPDELEINTIDDFLYMGIKNDVSCIIDDYMLGLEHQSTYNPNMPLRGIVYFGKLYDSYISERGYSIYGRKLIKLPTPRYFVLYNGSGEEPDRKVFRLSDAFAHEDKSGDFEWTATVLNVNYGHNEEILNACKVLKEYSIFIETVRKYKMEGYTLKAAVDMTVDESIDKGILREYLIKHKAEVEGMLFTETYEEAMEIFKKDCYRDAWEEGRQDGREEGIKEEHNNALQKLANSYISMNSELSAEKAMEMAKAVLG